LKCLVWLKWLKHRLETVGFGTIKVKQAAVN
jgi:hypothetical protein